MPFLKHRGAITVKFLENLPIMQLVWFILRNQLSNIAQVAAPAKGSRVLDLAAAQTEKSAHLLSYLDNTGLLVSNEINPKRSKILVENIERFGAKCCWLDILF